MSLTAEERRQYAAEIVASQVERIEYCEVYEREELEKHEEDWEEIFNLVNAAKVKIYIEGEEYV